MKGLSDDIAAFIVNESDGTHIERVDEIIHGICLILIARETCVF